jgi:hypothetical protein
VTQTLLAGTTPHAARARKMFWALAFAVFVMAHAVILAAPTRADVDCDFGNTKRYPLNCSRAALRPDTGAAYWGMRELKVFNDRLPTSPQISPVLGIGRLRSIMGC